LKEGLDVERCGNKIAAYLLNNHIKPSYSRVKILEYIIDKRNHPTVEEIYSELLKELPTLSKTTVYNTLNTLLKANLIRLITIEEHEARYDADITEHGHFKCLQCGCVYDFGISLENNNIAGLDGFLIEDKNVYFKGVCQSCLENKNKIEEVNE